MACLLEDIDVASLPEQNCCLFFFSPRSFKMAGGQFFQAKVFRLVICAAPIPSPTPRFVRKKSVQRTVWNCSLEGPQTSKKEGNF